MLIVANRFASGGWMKKKTKKKWEYTQTDSSRPKIKRAVSPAHRVRIKLSNPQPNPIKGAINHN